MSAGVLATALLHATSTTVASAPPWQRITYPPLPIPGTDHEVMNVSVSQEVIVDTDRGRAYQPVGMHGTTDPSFLRLDLSWFTRDEFPGKPRARPQPIADEKNIRLALHQGGAIQHAEPPGWIGVSNAGSIQFSLIVQFPWSSKAVDEAWIELQAAGRTYWIELPYGLSRTPANPEIADARRGAPQFPVEMRALSDTDVLVPWAAVRYELDRGASLEMIDACDGRARVTLGPEQSISATIDSVPIVTEIRRVDGRVLKGREVERSIGPRQSLFDFPRLSGRETTSRTWDAINVEIAGAPTTAIIPSSLFLLGHRLANWGDRHRIPGPDANCRD